MAGDGNSKSPAVLWLLLVAVALIGIVSMPREEYSGDARVLRCETVALINYQDLDVPARLAHSLEANSGNYFFENKSNHRFYCKYGVLNDLMYVPPLLIEKWHDGKLEYLSDNRAIYLNWFNIIFIVASAWYLFLIASRYTSSQILAAVFVLIAFYCTFWWNYLRAQSYEIYQVVFMLGFYYHLTSAIRNSRRRDLMLAGAWLGALILVKTVYVVLIPVVYLVLPMCWLDGPAAWPALLRRGLWLGLPIACFGGALLASNTYQYGSPFETGWSQGDPMFSGHFLAGLVAYLFRPSQSIFLYFPIFTIGLIAYPAFFKGYRADAILFSSIGLVMILVYSKLGDWSGGWGYGPRYMLPYLPLLSLPFLRIMEFFSKHWRKWWVGICAVVVAAILAWSLHFQLNVNAVPFFAYYKLENFFLGFHVPEVDSYFRAHTLGEVDADLVAYKHGKPWRPFELMEPLLNPQGIAEVKSLLQLNTASNYYFWPDSPPRD